jgi:hypothetical protein
MVMTAKRKPAPKLLKLDLGCGPNPREDFIGCDRIKFDKVTHVFDIGAAKWPFPDNSVEEVHASHFLEHLEQEERVHFFNELYRVLIPDGKTTIIVPHWGSCRAYGDPTHKWPPLAEFFWYYLSQKWRDENAPHTDKKHWKKGFNCDLEATWGYGVNPVFSTRNAEFQQFAVNHYREGALDMHATILSKKPA